MESSRLAASQSSQAPPASPALMRHCARLDNATTYSLCTPTSAHSRPFLAMPGASSSTTSPYLAAAPAKSPCAKRSLPSPLSASSAASVSFDTANISSLPSSCSNRSKFWPGNTCIRVHAGSASGVDEKAIQKSLRSGRQILRIVSIPPGISAFFANASSSWFSILHGNHWPLTVCRFVGNSTTITVVSPSTALARFSIAFL
mmetsp:Transcript_3525/g.15535  ORF Transcript_3525/g.15535 Transcript_3525/m.15535 type:complete len:202 (-) Transcript_3525:345-950(-)